MLKPKPKRVPSEVFVGLKGYQVVLSRPRACIELHRANADRTFSLVNRYSMDSVEEVQLFLGPVGHRKVLRLDRDVGLDLGEGLTSLESLAEARDVARLTERLLQIRVMDYRDAYFADAAPLLYAYLLDRDRPVADSVDFELKTLIHDLSLGPATPSGDEEITLVDVPAV